jgi:hypothetical protein
MIRVVGVLLIVMGIGQIVTRGRFARANAASNNVLFNGRLSGRGFVGYSKTMSLVVGVVLTVVGLFLLFS